MAGSQDCHYSPCLCGDIALGPAVHACLPPSNVASGEWIDESLSLNPKSLGISKAVRCLCLVTGRGTLEIHSAQLQTSTIHLGSPLALSKPQSPPPAPRKGGLASRTCCRALFTYKCSFAGSILLCLSLHWLSVLLFFGPGHHDNLFKDRCCHSGAGLVDLCLSLPPRRSPDQLHRFPEQLSRLLGIFCPEHAQWHYSQAHSCRRCLQCLRPGYQRPDPDCRISNK